MQRILIIGCGGSGKSTLARELGNRTGLSVMHLDQIWWKPGSWEHLSQEEFDEQLETLLEQPKWIMDGNFDRTLEKRLEKCDTVLYLDYNRLVCIWGWLKRLIRFRGTNRPDMGPNCPEKFNWEFFRWIWNFNKSKRKKYYALLNQQTQLHVHIFRNRRQLRKYLTHFSIIE